MMCVASVGECGGIADMMSGATAGECGISGDMVSDPLSWSVVVVVT